jgi:UDP-glucose 4-epimerase
MRILITGACGLIGKKLAIYLSKNHDVFGVGRSICDDFEGELPFCYYQIDLSKNNALVELKRIPKNVDLIIHCAAQQPRMGLLYKDYKVGNLDTTRNIIEWAKSSKIKKMISFSTAAFLDLPQENTGALTEFAGVSPLNNYALSKMESEAYLKSSVKKYSLSIICFRLSSLVHEQQQGGVIYTYLNSALKNQDIEIYDQGRFMRNLIHIDSIVETIESSLDLIKNSKGFNLYNIGSKDSLTLLEIAEYIFNKTNSSGIIIPVDKVSRNSGHLNISVSKAIKDLNYNSWTSQKILDTYISNISSAN